MYSQLIMATICFHKLPSYLDNWRSNSKIAVTLVVRYGLLANNQSATKWLRHCNKQDNSGINTVSTHHELLLRLIWNTWV